MNKLIKSNKIIIFILLLICIIFIIQPAVYSKSCLNAISVWSISVLPVLFPFFIITRLIVNLYEIKQNKMDKFFKKVYHTPSCSTVIFFLSIISGYPMGAKLICSMYDKGHIDTQDAKRLMSFCSISGPMFIVGTVGVSILCSYKAGLIILIANIIASLLNGLIYRGKKYEKNDEINIPRHDSSNLLHDSMYDSIISILIVGGFIVFSFLLIDILKNLHIIEGLSTAICSVFHLQNSTDVVSSILSGCIEMTRGIIDLSGTNISLTIKTIISSGLIGFGGVSILLQSITFIYKLKIPTTYILKQKLTQSLLCVLVTIPLAIIFI